MEYDKGLAAFRREVRLAWANGCCCELCLSIECVEQDRAEFHSSEFLAMVYQYLKTHGERGYWPDVLNFALVASSNRVRRIVGWPELEIEMTVNGVSTFFTPESGSDPCPRPTSPPH